MYTDGELRAAIQWADRVLGLHSAGPIFSFRSDGISLEPASREQAALSEDAFVRRETIGYRDLSSGLVVEVETRIHSDFPAVEWLVRLRNEGPEPTEILERILPLDVTLPLNCGAQCTIHHAKGALCSPDDFAPVHHALRPKGRLHLAAGHGRSSSECMPFANIDFAGSGIMLGIGWTGEWAMDFERSAEGNLRIQAGMARTHLRLVPGEEIRTPLVLALCWEGEPIRGHNLLRRFIIGHHRPLPEGPESSPFAAAPLCNGNWGGTPAHVHLDNIAKISEHDLPFEYYWIDAEWFGKPGHWMENAGNWTPRPDLYPEGFAPISEALHLSGRKFLLWFEPERVAPGTPWASELGDWLLEAAPDDVVTWADYGEWMSPEDWVKWESARNQLGAGDRLLNLGHPDACRFLTDFLSARITEFGIDCLRWDSNIAHLAYWRNADAEDRQGITEIRYVEGQYRLWDELLTRHPGLIIDNCASGGRRIDVESISRTTPLWRSDYTVGHRDPTGIQCQTWGLMHWVPLNGTGGIYLHQCDAYTLRSIMCASLAVGLYGIGDAAQPSVPPDYPFEQARLLLQEYLSVRDYFLGDFYPLTEYTRAEDAWMTYQLDRPEQGDGLLVVLKRPRSPYETARFILRALDPEREYELHDLDRDWRTTASGETLLREGIQISLNDAPDSALVRYRSVEP